MSHDPVKYYTMYYGRRITDQVTVLTQKWTQLVKKKAGRFLALLSGEEISLHYITFITLHIPL